MPVLSPQVQGHIKLKTWLSTKESRRSSEEDENAPSEVEQHQQLYSVFVEHQLSTLNKNCWDWDGSICQAAKTILHQHAIQVRRLGHFYFSLVLQKVIKSAFFPGRHQ